MTVWLNPDQVAERIGVARRTAMAMMLEMQPVFISGKVRRRIRVSEESLEQWMVAHCQGRKPRTTSLSTRKLARRR